MNEIEHFDVAILGSGFSGLGMAIRLLQRGHHHFVVLERADEVGGTWHYNSYPGCACDVPSHLYSFSFAQRRDWSRLCSPQEEILTYLQGVARDQGVEGLVSTGTEVEGCQFSDETRRWTVSAAD